MLHQRRVTVAQRHEDPLAAAEANPDQSMQKCKKSSPVAERQSIQSEAIPPNVIGIARNNTTTQSTSRASHLDCFADARNDEPAIAVALGLAPAPSSPPGLTRWSMLTSGDQNIGLLMRRSRMDCRVKARQ
jgi:hypothetical protein